MCEYRSLGPVSFLRNTIMFDGEARTKVPAFALPQLFAGAYCVGAAELPLVAVLGNAEQRRKRTRSKLRVEIR